MPTNRAIFCILIARASLQRAAAVRHPSLGAAHHLRLPVAHREVWPRWHYGVRLAGHTYRDRLVDPATLLEWLLHRLREQDPSHLAAAALLPLLQLCAQVRAGAGAGNQ
jgi:hypothetical protein